MQNHKQTKRSECHAEYQNNNNSNNNKHNNNNNKNKDNKMRLKAKQRINEVGCNGVTTQQQQRTHTNIEENVPVGGGRRVTGLVGANVE